MNGEVEEAMDKIDKRKLEDAARLLENPSWTAQVTNLVGMPLEWAVKRLPNWASGIISKATISAIRAALELAILTMEPTHQGSASKWWHRFAVMISGGIGGFFGLPGLAAELPVSTTIMLRSIADIARSEGEDLSDIDTKLACVQVFALGGPRSHDDSSESGYYAVRLALARAVSEAAEYIAEKGLAEEGAPILVRLVTRIAARFEVIVSEKVAAEIIPIVGAVGGATINVLFIKHFQAMARGHFMVRSLERQYGCDEVKRHYDVIAEAHR